jgi:hypothetical protein
MAVLHTRIVLATILGLALGLISACDRTKKVPTPTTGASGAMSGTTPRVDGSASAPR